MRLSPPALVAFGLLAAACISSVDQTTPGTTVPPSTITATTLPPQEQDTITIGTTDSLTNLDTADAYSRHDWELLANIGQGLLELGPGEPAPGVAESYEVSDGGRTYTFRLREGVSFGDGTELTAPLYLRHATRLLELSDRAGAALAQPFVSSVEAVDDHTLVFRLTSAFGFFPAAVGGVPYHPSHPALPEAAIEPLPASPVYGVGAWMITSYEQGRQVVLEPSPFYPGTAPKVDRVIVRYFEDPGELRAALFDGEIDVAWPIGPEAVLDDEVPAGIVGYPAGGGPIKILVVNHTLAPTDSLTVRRAIAAAIDREALASVVGLAAQSLWSPIPWGHLGASSSFQGAPDVDEAQRLLIEAGYTQEDPLSLTLDYPSDRYGASEAMEVVASQLEATGMITVEVRPTEWDVYAGTLLAGSGYALALLEWSADYFDPNPYVEPFTAVGGLGTNVSDPDSGQPTSGLSSPELIGLVEQAARESSSTVRAELYEEIQSLWASDVVTIPLWLEAPWIFYREGRGAAPDDEIYVDPTLLLDYSTLTLNNGS